MTAVVLPFAAVREVHVFWDFGLWGVTLVCRGHRMRKVGAYADLDTATRCAERLRRLERIPSAPVIRPREVLDVSDDPTDPAEPAAEPTMGGSAA